MESEYEPEYIGGCLGYNVHGKLQAAMKKLHESQHVVMDKNSITIFERPGFDSLPLTRIGLLLEQNEDNGTKRHK